MMWGAHEYEEYCLFAIKYVSDNMVGGVLVKRIGKGNGDTGLVECGGGDVASIGRML